jgi:hypothetical protein
MLFFFSLSFDSGVTTGAQKPSALTSVIYPALGKVKPPTLPPPPPPSQPQLDVLTRARALTLSQLLQANQDDEAVITCLAQLKVAFDNAEKVKPGISHTFIALMIETLRGSQQR